MVNEIYKNWVTTTSFWTISGLFVGRVAFKAASGFSYTTQITWYKKENFMANKIYKNWVTTTSFWMISGLFVGRVAFKGASGFSYPTQITWYKKREFCGK